MKSREVLGRDIFGITIYSGGCLNKATSRITSDFQTTAVYPVTKAVRFQLPIMYPGMENTNPGVDTLAPGTHLMNSQLQLAIPVHIQPIPNCSNAIRKMQNKFYFLPFCLRMHPIVAIGMNKGVIVDYITNADIGMFRSKSTLSTNRFVLECQKK